MGLYQEQIAEFGQEEKLQFHWENLFAKLSISSYLAIGLGVFPENFIVETLLEFALSCQGHSRPFSTNTEKLELPSISQVHTLGPVDVPWYNHHSSQRPLLSGDRLPNFHLPHTTPSNVSSGANSSRIDPLDSSSSGSQYTPSQTRLSSYPSASSGVGLKTPSPSPTSHHLAPQNPGLPDPSQQLDYSAQNQSVHFTEPYSSAMNQSQQYLDSNQAHISSAQSYAPQPTTASGMNHFSHYPQQPQALQTGPGSYAPSPSSFSQYGYPNGVTSPQGGGQPVSASLGSQMNSQLLPLPGKSFYCPATRLTLS